MTVVVVVKRKIDMICNASKFELKQFFKSIKLIELIIIVAVDFMTQWPSGIVACYDVHTLN